MASNHDDQSSIRRYLLHQLTDEEHQQIEQRLLTEDELFDQLQAAEDDLVDQYITGSISKDDAEMFEKHFLATPERQQKLRFAKAFRRYVADHAIEQSQKASDKARAPWTWPKFFSASPLRAAAFAALILVAGLGVWRIFFYQSDIDRGLVALNSAYRERRPVEARITQLNYAPFVTTRGSGSDGVNESELRRAELTLLDALNKKPTPAAHHALGKVYLARKDFNRAIEQFEEALKVDPNNAQIHADLGAALLEKGKRDLQEGERGAGLQELGRSLEYFDTALKLNPALLEALFNKALSLQAMLLPSQAKEAWKQYLLRDSNSQWAGEARRNLQLLEETKPQGTSTQVLRDFMDAYRERNDDAAWQTLSQTREMITETIIPLQLARSTLQSKHHYQGKAYDESIPALLYAGGLEVLRTGDPYFLELGHYYASSSPAQDHLLGVATQSIGSGYESCLRAEYDEALGHFQKARTFFERAGNIWEVRLTDYWIAYGYSRLGRINDSTALLQDLAQFSKARGYKWLLMQALLWIGSNDSLQNEYSKSLENNYLALAIADAISDTYAQQKALTQIADDYNDLGAPQRAMPYIQRALSSNSNKYISARQMWRNYNFAADTFYALKLFTAAVACGRESLRLAVDSLEDPATKHSSYLRLGRLYGANQDFDEALRLVKESLQISQSLTHDPAGETMSAYSELQLGNLARQSGDCRAGLNYYNDALRFYQPKGATGFTVHYYETRKGRLLCYLNLDDDRATQEELRSVLDLFDQNRTSIVEEQNRNSFFDKEQSVYDVAMAYEESNNRPEQAFAYSEASHARSLLDILHDKASLVSTDVGSQVVFSGVTKPIELSAIRSRIPKQVQLVEYAVLPEKLLVWVISSTDFNVVEIPVRADSLNGQVIDFLEALKGEPDTNKDRTRELATKLHAILISPIEYLLTPEKVLCLVPDKNLNQVPFAALISPQGQDYLIAKYTLLYAPSASVFLLATEAAGLKANSKTEKLVVVGNPSFDHAAYSDLPDLPTARREAKAISDFYLRPSYFDESKATKENFLREITSADVIHFAGHYLVDERFPLQSKLLLAKKDRTANDGAVTLEEIFDRKFNRPRLIVLSACRTGMDRYYDGEGAVGLARTFLGAGVTLVIGSQWPVDSEATAQLMIDFHRYRTQQGLNSADALRQAQLSMLSGTGGPLFREPYYWAAFAPLGGYAAF